MCRASGHGCCSWKTTNGLGGCGIALRDGGYLILEAADGRTAIAQAQGYRIDVVILDLMLPDCDGFEVCRTLRRRSDVPVILASAREDSHDIVAGL